MTTETKTRIRITMSETAPVNIDPEEWPVVARVFDHDGQVKCQANTEWEIQVREHRDGRRLVYGYAESGYGGKPAGWRPSYAGYLVPSRDGSMREPSDDGPLTSQHPDDTETIRAIRRVAGVIGREDMAATCIGNLPAHEI